MIFGLWVGLGPKVCMVTLMEVKGHQRSNGVNYVLCLPYLVKRSPDASWEWWWPWWRSEVKWGKLCAMSTIFGQALMQAEKDDDLDGDQRSSEVKWGKLCAMATIFGQKMCLMQAKNDDDLNWGQRSEVKWGKLCAMATIFGQKKRWRKLRMITLMEVKGHQRSNGVNYVVWLPYLVKRSTNAS